MKLLFFELHNYAGIANGMNLDTISIDFSKAKHTVVLICGMNGVGKSTLLKAMTPLPDSTDAYVANKEAHKRMIILDHDIIYDILIESNLNGQMVRQPNKAYVRKNGLELNPTGNISSYKDVIFDEFELDANYITLSKLSSDDRGLAVKTPAERKKYIAAMLSTLDTYNAINKKLVSKANIFKSHVNNLDDKIKSIGDPGYLESSMAEVSKRYEAKKKEKEALIAKKAEAVGFINSVDPTGRIQEQYEEIHRKIIAINASMKEITDKYGDISGMDFDTEIINENKLLSKLESSKEKLEEKRTEIINSRSAAYNKIDIDEQKLENLKNGFEIDNLERVVLSLREETKSLKDEIKGSEDVYQAISKDDFLRVYDTLVVARDGILDTTSHYSQDIIIRALGYIGMKNINLEQEMSKLDLENESINVEIASLTSKAEDIGKALERSAGLSNRPKNCKIDTCPFIKEMLDTIKQKKDLEKKFKSYSDKILDLKQKHADNVKEIQDLRSISKLIESFNSIFALLDANDSLISKFKPVQVFAKVNRNSLIDAIGNGNLFNEVDSLLEWADGFDTSDSIKLNEQKLITLEADYKVALAKKESIDMLEESLVESKRLVSESSNKEKELDEEINALQESIVYHSSNVTTLESKKAAKDQLDEYEKAKKDLARNYDKIKGDIATIKQYVDNMNLIDGSLAALEQEIPALEREKDSLIYSITNVREYIAELNKYKEKFNTVNTLKKYSSPTTGIQTIYMNMYMGKTLTLANELLGMMFGGEYRLLPYAINENEFRIPFIGNGLPVDDISSGSTSQLCIIGTIMNLVLLYQASTKYNIVTLDEIDGGLDNHNRYDFIPTLYKLIEVLNINQLVMISHNIESDLTNVDVIKLKGYEDDDIDLSNVNVIYDYNSH